MLIYIALKGFFRGVELNNLMSSVIDITGSF
jgi:hypothetical protein